MAMCSPLMPLASRTRKRRPDRSGTTVLSAAWTAWSADPPLTTVTAASLALLAATMVGLVVDHRVITGAPAWLKPAKFALSIGIYSATFLWLLRFVSGRQRLVRIISTVTAAAALGELTIIAGQALRGTTSHFNYGTPLDTALWATMGTMIMALWLANLVAAVLLLRQPLPDRAFAWSLRLGLLLALVGMLAAVPMGAAGAHTVGLADGGPGLPLLGWSTVAGDLRVGHFVGLHALQLVPLAGWLLRSRFGLQAAQRTGLIWVIGVSYLGLTVILTWQALRGQSVVAPDATTWAALAALSAASVVAAAVVLRGRRAAGTMASSEGAATCFSRATRTA